MANMELATVECILRISSASNLTKDLKVNINEDLLEDDSWGFEDIYSGASQTLLQKYLPLMKEPGVKISLLRPFNIDEHEFTEFLEDADTNQAKADIDAILASLSEEKRHKVLQSLKDK